jgi:hypothetical protein
MSGKPRLARRSLAEGSASLVLRELRIDRLPIDPEAIAAHKGIVVQPMPATQHGASGMLVKAGDEFGIMYATHIPSRGFQRFSIAHELGHYCIDGHVAQLLTNGSHYSYAGFISADPFEQEADHFAAALLMPDRLFCKAMDGHLPGLDCVEGLGKICGTSLTATAIRYAGLTRDGVAVILSSGNTIEWCFISDGLKGAKGLSWLRKGTLVPGGTTTEAFNALPENVRIGKKDKGAGRLNDWMGGDRVYRVEEEIVGLGQYGRTLTILTCKQLANEADSITDDDESEEAMIERWTPRFR